MTIKKESWYTIKEGDSLSKIAKAASVVDWRIIYNHPENSSFRKDNPNPDTIKPDSKLWIPLEIRKTTGATLINLEKKRDAICVADAHMHIQSGHVGTLPFALGAVVCDYRKMVLDIPTSMVLENLDRNLLDNYATFYDKHRWFIKKWIVDPKPIQATSDALVKVVADGTSQIIEIINMMFSARSVLRDETAEITIQALSKYVEIVQSAPAMTEELVLKLNNLSSLVKNKNALHILSLLNMLIAYKVYIISNYAKKGIEITSATIDLILEQQRRICESIIKVLDSLIEIDKKVYDVFFKKTIQVLGDVTNKTVEVLVMLNPNLYVEKFKGLILNFACNYSEFFAVQKEKTFKIAAMTVERNTRSLFAYTLKNGFDSAKVFAPIIALPMDLDFAHIDRFESDTKKAVVYRYTNKRYYYKSGGKNPFGPETSESELEEYRILHALVEEYGDFYYFHSRISGKNKGKLVWVNPTEYKLYEKWDVQREDSIVSALQNPWRIIPLYHFEPRRYSGNCEDAFQYVMHKSSKAYIEGKKYRLFAGIKVYPNLGYKPLDPRLPSLNTLYERCVENDIPIMTHGSPQGAFTHDRPFYYEYDVAHNTIPVSIQRDIDYNVKNKSAKDATYYFMQEYASPYAWEQVLKKYPDLRLCIAHFGGSDNKPTKKEPLSGWNKTIDVEMARMGQWDTSVWNQKIISMIQTYKNLYTDISCHDVKTLLDNLPRAIEAWPDLRKRIMFGTDWYMTEIQGFSYEEFIDQMKDGIYKIDAQVRNSGVLPRKDPHLWEWFTEINPFRFYRFDRIAHEYTKELERGINAKGTSQMKDSEKEMKISFAKNQELLIYKIAKHLVEIGELPKNDAKTSSS
jgi:predicted TIM-barrel fold metal-dependent hydrolase